MNSHNFSPEATAGEGRKWPLRRSVTTTAPGEKKRRGEKYVQSRSKGGYNTYSC